MMFSLGKFVSSIACGILLCSVQCVLLWFFVWGPHKVMLKVFSWLCAKGSDSRILVPEFEYELAVSKINTYLLWFFLHSLCWCHRSEYRIVPLVIFLKDTLIYKVVHSRVVSDRQSSNTSPITSINFLSPISLVFLSTLSLPSRGAKF